ncbi:ABC-2 transporter permease [Bacillus fonticola]|uniref:ABC-2 transporter permease n=1 Tax=Bacillus fonticola TaxID=2728853 RepID=UPI00147341B4|nr:ABC-2 transporter permease [Bacillus fonticola]
MSQLVLKDILIQNRLMLMYVGLVVLYLFLQIPFMYSISIIAVMYIINTHYYERRGNTSLLMNSLPYTRKQIVTSKYIGAAIATFGFTIMTLLLQSLFTLLLPNPIEHLPFTGREIGTSLLVVMVTTAVYLPIYYRFSNNYLLIGMSFVIVLSLVLAGNLVENISMLSSWMEWWNTLPIVPTIGVGLFVFIVIYGGSWWLCLRIYERKDLV